MLSVTVCDVWGTRVKSAPLVVGVDYRGTGFIQEDFPARYLPHVALSLAKDTQHYSLQLRVYTLYFLFIYEK